MLKAQSIPNILHLYATYTCILKHQLCKKMPQGLVQHLQIWRQSMAVHADSAGRHPASWGHLGINHCNLNMWGWMCSIAALQSRVGCVISNGVQFCPGAPLQYCVKAQPHSRANLFYHTLVFFLFFYIPPACTTLVSAPQHTTPKPLCWPLVHRTCSLLHLLKTCASPRRKASCNMSTMPSQFSMPY